MMLFLYVYTRLFIQSTLDFYLLFEDFTTYNNKISYIYIIILIFFILA